MSYVVIHIGANKTGSTTLQRRLFSQIDQLLYLGEDCDTYDSCKNILNSIVADDDIHFDLDGARQLFDSYLTRSVNKPFLYSNEDIMTSRVPSLCAKRLASLLPGAEILVVIRNQLTAIPSWYANHGAYLRYVPRAYWRRYVSFDDWMEYCVSFMNYSPLDGFFYNRILSLYSDLFGSDKIHILLYEDLLQNQHMFMSNLCRILRIDVDRAIALIGNQRERKRNTERELAYHRFRSSFFYQTSLSRYIPFGAFLKRRLKVFLSRGRPAGGFVSEQWHNKIVEVYGRDNAALAGKYGLPLQELGYPVKQ